ncbi:hypothetical protein VNO77_03967 [Canavalia gladiata]|uniref:Uncharacterized protein n=1 Tax=Canavalia gladiata TaxID=3824 RepID=A0AAN9RCQ7_CANGL
MIIPSCCNFIVFHNFLKLRYIFSKSWGVRKDSLASYRCSTIGHAPGHNGERDVDWFLYSCSRLGTQLGQKFHVRVDWICKEGGLEKASVRNLTLLWALGPSRTCQTCVQDHLCWVFRLGNGHETLVQGLRKLWKVMLSDLILGLMWKLYWEVKCMVISSLIPLALQSNLPPPLGPTVCYLNIKLKVWHGRSVYDHPERRPKAALTFDAIKTLTGRHVVQVHFVNPDSPLPVVQCNHTIQ